MLAADPNLNDEDILEKRAGGGRRRRTTPRSAIVGKESFGGFERNVMLQSVDTHWREHLAALDHLRQGIHLRGYAQKNPKQEYKREAFELFGSMLDMIKNEVIRTVMTVRIQSREEIDAAEAAMAAVARGKRQLPARRLQSGRGAGRTAGADRGRRRWRPTKATWA